MGIDHGHRSTETRQGKRVWGWPMHLNRLAVMAALFLSSAAPILAQPAQPVPYQVPRSHEFILESPLGPYRIMVSWPEAKAPPQGYPVLYLLDGNDNFAIAAEAARKRAEAGPATGVGPGIVVGIGYPGPTRRALDYTPAAPPSPPFLRLDGTPYPEQPGGGADRFLDFIEKELKPRIERDFPVDRSHQSLMGHSFGGLFVLHTLFTRPDSFQTYIAASPSTWYGGRHILAEEREFAGRLAKASLSAPRTLILTAGEYEQSIPPHMALSPAAAERAHNGTQRRMVDNAREMAWRLETLRPQGLTTFFRIFPAENHGSVVLPATGNALPYAFPFQEGTK